ncbi:hypothetical protein ACUN8C_01845 [Kushneria sp. Sum13]|uniref:hypothetical protein n=1 Tax=Kushneria sp. Sum13 TaxID=3459196 RepID=UPI0040466AF3
MTDVTAKPRQRAYARFEQQITAPAPARPEAFTFGEPVPVTDLADFLYTGCWMANARWYEPPVDLAALAKMYRATAHHGSGLQVKAQHPDASALCRTHCWAGRRSASWSRITWCSAMRISNGSMVDWVV